MKRLLLLVSLPLSINLQAQMGAMTGCSYPARKLVSVTDTVPSSFTFTDVPNASISTVYTSNAITVSGINTPTHISISGGTFNVNSGSYGSTKTTVSNGDVISIRNTSSGSFSTTVNSVLTIGGVTDTYSITTVSLDSVPSSFVFTDVTGATTSTVYTSNTVTISGMNSAATIRITGGTYSKNGGGYVSAQGTINNGDNVSVRVASSSSSSTAVNATVTIGGVSDTYTVTTGSDASTYYAAIAANNTRSFFVGANAYKDRNLTNRATTSGDNVLAVKDYTSSQKLEFTTWTPTNPITNNNGQTSTFYGAAWGEARTYPAYDPKLGGSIVSSNTSYKNYVTTFADIPLPAEITTVFSLMPTVYGEYLTSGCYSFSLRKGYVNDLMVEWGCMGGQLTRAANTWKGAFMEMVIVHQTMYANGWLTTRWTYSGGDQVKVDSVQLPIGPGVLRDQYLLSNGHPPNVRVYSMSIKAGSAHTPASRQQDINNYKQVFNIGQKPNEPFCTFTLTEGGSGTGTYYDLSYTYDDGGTGLPLDLNACTWNWGGTKKPATGCSGCNFLDIQQLLKTTNGNTTRFYVSEFPAFFDVADNDHTLTFGGTCPNTAGQSFGFTTAENGYY